jgi:ketosteroid isomerase-like protein
MEADQEFIAETSERFRKAADAAHNGDPTLFLELWSTTDPVTVFGPLGSATGGWGEVRRTLRGVVSRFSGGTPLDLELVAAEVGSELAYTVGYERSAVSFDGGPVKPVTLRVTHIYRREHGDWKLVHRHGDYLPTDQHPPAAASTA